MRLRFFSDQCVPAEITDTLRRHGHQVGRGENAYRTGAVIDHYHRAYAALAHDTDRLAHAQVLAADHRLVPDQRA